MACLRKIKELNDTDDDDDIDNDDIAREEAPFRIEKHHPRGTLAYCHFMIDNSGNFHYSVTKCMECHQLERQWRS